MSRQTIKFKSGGVDITAELFSPAKSGKQPVVILAYGTGGMMPPFDSMYISFAEGLAEAGFYAFLPYYLNRTGTRNDLDMFVMLPTYRESWISALHDAVIYAKTLKQIDADRVALCGFSLGGNLMIHVAQTYQADVLVDFFAPIISKVDSASVVNKAMAKKLPPTLIHHGEDDGIVPVGDSDLLDQWLKEAKIVSTLIRYGGQGHPSFDSSSWSIKSQSDSLAETIKFLRKHLT